MDEQPFLEIPVGDCTYTIDEEHRLAWTTFPDGTKLVAAPNFDDDSVDLACDLGYDSTWAMSRDHELLHTIIAFTSGLPYSPTLWKVAHPEDPDNISNREVAIEEAAVLHAQKLLRSQRGEMANFRLWNTNSDVRND